MKATVGSLAHTFGTIEWTGEQYKVTGLSRKFLAEVIPVIEERTGLSGPDMLNILPEYFGGADKWVKLEP